jgi:vacuolar-type H+-ATPase subunit F/Vma7
MNDSELFVIGDENAVFGFALLGIEGEAVQSGAEAHAALSLALARRDLAILFVTDEWAQVLRSDLDRLMVTLSSPLIVEIPGSSQPGGRPSLRAQIQQALDIRLER